MSDTAQDNGKKKAALPAVIRATPFSESVGTAPISLYWVLPIWGLSAAMEFGIIGLFYLVTVILGSAPSALANENEQAVIETKVEEAPQKLDLTNPDEGIDPTVPLNFDVTRLAEISVPGTVDPTQAVGIANAETGAQMNVPPPPGMGAAGQGGGISSPVFGAAPQIGLPGGSAGLKYVPGGFAGRSVGTREQMAMQGGGSKESESSVAMALEWLALHQSGDGRWSLDRFQQHGRDKVGPGARQFTCNCRGSGQSNDVAATAFGLLPFLAAGQTHKPASAGKSYRDYSKSVEGGLKFLMSKQGRDGSFDGGMYAHGLASIALCEAYGMSNDPMLKQSAQRALDYIIYAQHEQSGGWRYAPKQSGDTSVTGWQVMAIKSGQMSGLSVPTPTLKGAEKWLDSSMDNNTYGYGYTGPQATPTMSAVGLLCRQYLGWSPRKSELVKGVEHLSNKYPPGQQSNMYYYYYATQVMHHMGGDTWKNWNNGANGKPGMRDILIAKQDKGTDPKFSHQRGSWAPADDPHGTSGGRIMTTSLAVLTLEVYYRHLPLYRRDTGAKPN